VRRGSSSSGDTTNITNIYGDEDEDKKDDTTGGDGGGGDGGGDGKGGDGGGKGGGGNGGGGKDPLTGVTSDPATGVYTGGPIPEAGSVTSDTDPFTAVNALTKTLGGLGASKEYGEGGVDKEQAYELGGLAKGKGAGDTKKQQKQNESMIANLLSFGQPNVINTGKDKDKDKDKGKDKGKDKDTKNKGGGDKNKTTTTTSTVSNVLTGPVKPDESGGVQDTKDKDKDKDKDKGKDKDKKK
jgi:hypothetical protein